MTENTKILLVEDLPTDAELAEREIRKTLPECLFHRVETRESYLDAVSSFQPDIIVSDYKLPYFDGLTALKLALEHVPETPFIVLTGSMNEETAVECMKAGAWDYVIKEHIRRLGPAVLASLDRRNARGAEIAALTSLKENEELFRKVFQKHAAVKLILDPDTGAIVDANEAAEEFYGWTVKQLRSMKIHEINSLSPEEIEAEIVNARSREKNRFEFRHNRADGSIRDVEVFSSKIQVKGKELLHSIIHDISERKKSEMALRESEQRYKAVVQNLHTGIAILNRKMEIVWINPVFHHYYPRARPGEGLICYETCIDEPRTRPCGGCPCVRTFRDGLVHEEEMELATQENMRCFRVMSCPLKNEQDEVELVVELVEDITERKSLQSQLAQAQKMEAIGTLAGGVAHDFNNILQVVLGYSELIHSDDRFPDLLRENLEKVIHSTRSGAELVQRLLTLSRKTEFRFLRINLNRRIEQLQKMLSRTLPKMIEIELILDEQIDSINADPTQTEQILINLAVNARDAMPEGGRLTVETETVELDEEYCRTNLAAKTGRHVLLTVSDTGHGIDKVSLQHIFEPFFTTKGSGQGTGLGLAMVYGIVKEHGGHITCYSVLSQGTTFRIYFPAVTGEDVTREKAKPTAMKGGSETILLVDDEQLIRDLGSRILTKAGYKIIEAANGLEALDAYRENQEQISLVILDVIMPEMGGVNASRSFSR